MLHQVNDFQGFSIRGTDGEIGRVGYVLFDDEVWVMRFLVVGMGSWPIGRRVLVAPASLERVDWSARKIEATLTTEQISGSPQLDAHPPVCRQHELELLDSLVLPVPSGPGLDVLDNIAMASGLGGDAPIGTPSQGAVRPRDPHLRSTQEVDGYSLCTLDGEIGFVVGFVIDDENWAVRYLVVDTRHRWPARKVLVAPLWVADISWRRRRVLVGLSLDAVATAPTYEPAAPITRDYEVRLHQHYDRPMKVDRQGSTGEPRTPHGMLAPAPGGAPR